MTHPDARRSASPSADPVARQAAHVDHWDTRRRRVKLKGLTPEEFRSQSFAAQSLFKPFKFWDAVHHACLRSSGSEARVARLTQTILVTLGDLTLLDGGGYGG